MDSVNSTPILELSKTTERCVLGYEALYQQTRLSIEGHIPCSPLLQSFSYEEHGSDADDENTDLSGDYLSSSNELCVTPKAYYISCGTKPLSLVIRKCITPSAKHSPISILQEDTVMSHSITNETENASNEILSFEKKDDSNVGVQLKGEMILCNDTYHEKTKVNVALTSPTAGRSCKNLQEGICSSQESNQSVVTQEYIENVINESGQEEISTTHSVNHVSLLNIANDSLSENSVCVITSNICDREANVNHDKIARPLQIVDTNEMLHSSHNDILIEHYETEKLLSCNITPVKTSSPLMQTNVMNSFIKENSKESMTVQSEAPTCNSSLIHLDNSKDYFRFAAIENLKLNGENEKISESVAKNNVAKYSVEKPNDTINKIIESNLELKCSLVSVTAKEIELKNYTENVSDLIKSKPYIISSRTRMQVDSSAEEIRDSERNKVVNENLNDDSSALVLPFTEEGTKEGINNTGESYVENYEGLEDSNSYYNVDCNKGVLTADDTKPRVETELSNLGNNLVLPEQERNTTLKTVSDHSGENDTGEVTFLSLDNSECNMDVVSDSTTIAASFLKKNGNYMETKLNYISEENVSVRNIHEQLVGESDTCAHTCSSDLSIGMPKIEISSIITKDLSLNDGSTNVTSNNESSQGKILYDEFTENIETLTNTDCSQDETQMSQISKSPCVLQTFTEETMDCPYNEVTSYLEHSPLLFSSDDENSYYTETVANVQGKSFTDTRTSFDEILLAEKKKLHRLQVSLSGVPPPPSVTVPQLDVSDILRLLKENEKLLLLRNMENENGTKSINTRRDLLKFSTIEQVKSCSWPESKSCCYHDIQYNHGKFSEEFEILCQKLQERYVGCETSSSCNVWFSRDISNKVNKMTNKQKRTGHSPGARLSHLARRRQTFSSANLLNSVTGQLPGNRHSAAAERRLIMVKMKKNENRQKSKSYQFHKKMPYADCSKLQHTKRALFKSPSNNIKRIPSASKCKSGSKKNKSDIDRIMSSKRALWPSTSKDNAGHDRALTNLSGHMNVYGKRRREENDTFAQVNKYPRRKLFGDVRSRTDKNIMSVVDKSHSDKIGENKPQVPSHTQSDSRDLPGGLSELHKKKLLWAVAEALRAEGINMNHPSFRPCATTLARLVRNIMPNLNSKREGSTSDLLLQLATQHVKDVVKKQNNIKDVLNSRT
ncbi:uncharacterized protein mi [Periplaneta americana]|uniref:uncharacterized protein mi n=1 Tax=Periplaneta americana TaxID=6978 RepID=UPI0037E8404B